MGQDNNPNEFSMSKYYRSFSGTDALVFALLPQSSPVILGTITTISYSMFRDKKPVPLIGKINVGGFTRGTRIYAGTMVFTLINQHWVNELMDSAPWLKNFGRLKADELPLFDLMIVCANEYGASVQMFIYGVDITDEGQVLSIEDIFTENTFSFVARDLTNFASNPSIKEDFRAPRTIKTISNFNVKYDKGLNPQNFVSSYPELRRNIKYDPSNMLTGDDVIKIQTLLNNTGVVSSPITGTYDTQTFEAVKFIQSKMGLKVTGAIDEETYNLLDKYDGTGGSAGNVGNPRGFVIDKEGTTIYSAPDSASTPITRYNYKDSVEILSSVGDWYKTDKGYVSAYDVYTYLNDKSNMSFENVRQGDSGYAVTMVQNAINIINQANGLPKISETGIMTDDTVAALKHIQSMYGIAADGVVNKETWLALQEHSNIDSQAQANGTIYNFTNAPRAYNINSISPDILQNYGTKVITKSKPEQIRLTAIAHYATGEIKEFAKTVNVEANNSIDITPAALNDAFIYNPSVGKGPNSVEFVVYPVNGTAYKWILNIGG